MKCFPVFVALLGGLALSGCGQKEQTPASSATNENYSSGNPITAPVDYLGAVGKAKTFSEKSLDNATLNHAVQEFNAGEGRFPKDLNELITEKYLPRLPDPPYGMKYVYDATTGQVKVVAK